MKTIIEKDLEKIIKFFVFDIILNFRLLTVISIWIGFGIGMGYATGDIPVKEFDLLRGIYPIFAVAIPTVYLAMIETAEFIKLFPK